ncbi:MAG: hypothetical protein CMJ84_10210 [Planctomycetes bacterium]|nr:hypothetical protein [Planctomycetota bacterium]
MASLVGKLWEKDLAGLIASLLFVVIYGVVIYGREHPTASSQRHPGFQDRSTHPTSGGSRSGGRFRSRGGLER